MGWDERATCPAPPEREFVLQGSRCRDVRVVVLRDDGRPGLAVDASMRFSVPFLSTVGWWALGIGSALGLLGLGLIIWMIVLLSRSKRPPAATSTTAAPPS